MLHRQLILIEIKGIHLLLRRLLTFLVAVVLTVQPCLAWSAGGHHLICFMAFNKLPKAKQNRLMEILKQNPRFAEDFKPLRDGTAEDH